MLRSSRLRKKAPAGGSPPHRSLQTVHLSWWGRRFRLPSVNRRAFFRSLLDAMLVAPVETAAEVGLRGPVRAHDHPRLT
jgi:hypothetical protein